MTGRRHHGGLERHGGRRRHDGRKRFAALLAATALAAAACGGGDDDGSSADDTASPTESVADTGGATTDGDDSVETTDTTDTSTGDDGSGDEPADTSSGPAPLEDDEQLTSEGEGSSAADLDPVAGGEITFGFTNDGTGFDTTGAVAPGSIRVITALNDSLVGLDENAEWHPNLAESLTPNDDFTSWTIALRPEVRFHDGATVDATAVVANLEAYRSSPTTGFNFANVASITAVDDMTVEVAMNSPWAAFPYQLVSQAGWMVSPSTIGTNDDFVGTGPFVLESWTPGDGARVVRNPDYWRAEEGLPYLDAVNFKFLPDQTVRRQAFEAGDVEGYLSPGDEDIVEWLDDDDVDVWIGTAGANEYLWLMNTTVAPFDDLRVRRAMAHATDRQFLIDTFRSGLTEPADGPFNPSSRWYAETDYPDFDPDEARRLVDEYEAEVGPIEFTLSIEPNPDVIEVAEVMMSFLADVGIDGTIEEIGQGQSAITAIQDDFQAFSWFQFGAPDPDRDYVFFHSSGGVLNWSNLVDPEIDAGLDEARRSDDPAVRLEGYTRFQQALADQMPMLWVDHLNGIEAVATTTRLHGIGTPGVLPDGSPSLPMTDGNFFSWVGVWVEQ